MSKYLGVCAVKHNKLIIFILTIGVFGILNTEMGFIGLIPMIAEHFNVSVATAGWVISSFAISIAISGPIMPLLLSKVERKTVMIGVLIIFIISNIVSLSTTSFAILLLARIIPAIFHPVYVALALSVAADSVEQQEAPKAVSRVFIGVSAGMVVGVPIVNFLATQFNLSIALLFFAVVNTIVLILTIFYIPTMQPKESLSYGTQVSVLKRPLTWLSILISFLFNAAVFGVYSYFTDFLNTVTQTTGYMVSVTLFLYGLFNIVGNILAGKLLTTTPKKTILILPFLLIVTYLLMFALGSSQSLMVAITIILGTLGGISANVTQYVITSVATEAPDLSNGIFLSSVNLGTTVGTFIGGLFIATLGSGYVILIGILACIINIAMIFIRNNLIGYYEQRS